MTYHPDFWVVAGTASPVIALSCIVIAGNQLNIVLTLIRQRRTASNSPYYPVLIIAILGLVFNVVSFAFEAETLLFSLGSLAKEEDFASTLLVTDEQYISLIFLFSATLLTAATRIITEHRTKDSLHSAEHIADNYESTN